MTTDPTIDFDSADFVANPCPTYTALRHTDPVHWSTTANAFAVLRYDDVAELLREQGTERVRTQFDARQLTQLFGPTVAATDGKEHKRVRQFFTPHFAARAIQDYGVELVREVIQSVVEELDATKPVNVRTQLAIPIPYRIAARILGLPSGDEAWLFERIDVLREAIDFPSIPLEEAMVAKHELEKYLRDNKSAVQSQLVTNRPTLLRSLEDNGLVYGSTEFLNTALFFLLAITATSVGAIGTTIAFVLKHENKWPDDEAVPGIMQEAMRLDSPTQVILRYATENFELRGVPIKRHHPLLLFIGSANRDETVFEKPDMWWPGRPQKPGSSLTFGAGPHTCIGMPLAIAEIEALLRELGKQFTSIELAGPVGPAQSMGFRGPSSLTIHCKRQTTLKGCRMDDNTMKDNYEEFQEWLKERKVNLEKGDDSEVHSQLDSVGFVELLAGLEDNFGVGRIDDTSPQHFATLGTIKERFFSGKQEGE